MGSASAEPWCAPGFRKKEAGRGFSASGAVYTDAMYSVMYVGRDVPMAGYDGIAVRLRLVSDGKPVQLFRAIAPLHVLLSQEVTPGPDWWTEFARAGAAAIEEIVASYTPPPDPGVLRDIWPDLAEVLASSRKSDPYRRHLPVEPPIRGVEVRRFGPGFVDRRTKPRA